MTRKRKRRKRPPQGHILDDVGAYVPNKEELERRIYDVRRRTKLYPPDNKKRAYGKALNEVIRLDDHGLPRAD